MLRAAGRSAVVVATLCSLGCGEGSADGLDRKSVSGTVTLDGAPLAKGVISFDPAEGSPGTVPAGGVISGGSYSISASSGPTPGKYRVSIRSAGAGEGAETKSAPGMPPRKPEADPIPKQYNSASTLTAEIGSGGSASVDFKLTSK